MPFRGPEYYQSGQYTYKCNVVGDFPGFKVMKKFTVRMLRYMNAISRWNNEVIPETNVKRNKIHI